LPAGPLQRFQYFDRLAAVRDAEGNVTRSEQRGTRERVVDIAAKKINTTWLHQVGRELKPLVSESVVHANETPLPNGTVGFTPTELVTGISGQPVVVGTFRSRDAAVKDRWLLVANRSHSASARATVTVDPAKVSGVDVFQAISKQFSALRGSGVPVNLAPGAATLLRLKVK
jgi:hypothetical protein